VKNYDQLLIINIYIKRSEAGVVRSLT